MDMSKKPEGATHWFPGVDDKNPGWVKVVSDDYYFWGDEHTDWMRDPIDGPDDFPMCVALSTTPTLETMLTEWRDLQARAQAAQAEADALFEHAGQCHGGICVRLAELGWGAPRVAAVAGEAVCCTPTDEERQLLSNGDYTPEELWGGSRPTCPKCADRTAVAPLSDAWVIDGHIAPDGATHFAVESDGYRAAWMKPGDGEWYCMLHDSNIWQLSGEYDVGPTWISRPSTQQ